MIQNEHLQVRFLLFIAIKSKQEGKAFQIYKLHNKLQILQIYDNLVTT